MHTLLTCYRITCRASFVFGIALCAALAQAQTPDAGALQQQVEEQIPAPEIAQPQAPEVVKEPVKQSSGAAIEVKGFRFEGNHIISDEQLKQLVNPYLKAPLDFAGLQAVAAAVAEYYRQSGWLARAFLPKQEIVDGLVSIQIVEGKMGQVLDDGNAPARFKPSLGAQYIHQAQATGERVNTQKLDRALLLIDDLPGVNVTGNLTAGKNPGETDLVLHYVDQPERGGSFSLDNTGSRSTGSTQLGFNFAVNSPAKRGDKAELNVLKSQGLDYGRLAYGMPLGVQGWRFGVNATRMNYDVITSEFKALDLRGNFGGWGLTARYPIVRSRAKNAYFSSSFDYKAYQNWAGEVQTSDYRIYSLKTGLAANAYDARWGGGASDLSATLTVGELQLNHLDFAENLANEGGYSKLNLQLSRRQYLAPQWTLSGRLDAQLASGNLDSSEKFYLGGAYGVRAYPSNEGGGDVGLKAALEAIYQWRPDLSLASFLDYGQLTRNKNNRTAQADPNHYHLQGLGFRAAWIGPQGIQINATYAHRIGGNPNPNAEGKDQDGTLDKNRFWLAASYLF